MIDDRDEPGDEDQVEDNISEDEALESDSDENIDLTVEDDIVGESTAEIKVDKLVAKIDSEGGEEAAHHREVREKIEELSEQSDDELGGTYNFNIDEDL
jgi:hypothetical protein